MGKKTISIVAAVLAVALVVMGVLFILEKQTVGRFQEQQAEMTAEIDALTAQVDAKTAEIEALNADAADKASQIEALNADVADKSSQIEALNADAADKASQIEALSTDVADKSSQIDALSADSADKDAVIESLSAELEQMRQSNAKPEIPASVPGTYSATREFLYVLDQADISYSYKGIDSRDKESVTIDITCAGHSNTFRLWFSSDCEDVAMQVWDVISFSSKEKAAVRYACDELNLAYRFVCFYLEGDNTVTMSMDFIIRPDGTASDILFEGLVRAATILEEAYPTLEPYDS